MAYDLDDAKTGRSNDRNPDMKDLAEVFQFPEKKWTTIRLMKGVVSTARYWVKVKSKEGKATKFPTVCSSYDAETQERDSTKYDPWRDLQASERQKYEDQGLDKDAIRKKARIDYEQKYWMVGIIRLLQKNEPAKMPKASLKERKSGFKDKDSDSWTAKRVIRLGKSLADKIKQCKQLNIVEGKSGAKAFPVDDPKYGCDIRIYYDSKKSPADQYQVQIVEKRSPLSEDETAMLSWDLDGAVEQVMKLPKAAAIKADFEGWAGRNGVKLTATKKSSKDADEEEGEDGDDEEFDDEDDKPESKKKPAPKKKRPDPDEEEEEEEEDDFNEDEEEEEAPKKKGKKKPADEEEEEEEEEEETPKSKKKPAAKKAPVKKGKKKPADDEDDDDDFDD